MANETSVAIRLPKGNAHLLDKYISGTRKQEGRIENENAQWVDTEWDVNLIQPLDLVDDEYKEEYPEIGVANTLIQKYSLCGLRLWSMDFEAKEYDDCTKFYFEASNGIHPGVLIKISKMFPNDEIAINIYVEDIGDDKIIMKNGEVISQEYKKYEEDCELVDVDEYWDDVDDCCDSKCSDETDLHEEYYNRAYEAQKKGDYSTALEYYKKASEFDDGNAMNNVAVIYHNGLVDGKKDIDEAIKWYEMAVEKNNSMAVVNLARIYACHRHSPDNIEKSIKMLIDHSNGKNPDILAEIGRIYYNGLLGYVDYDLALQYLQLAADKGYKDNYYLGHLYLYDLAPNYHDIRRGLEILGKLAHGGDYDSAIDMAYYYYKRNELSEAQDFLDICYDLGHYDALERVKTRLENESTSLYK